MKKIAPTTKLESLKSLKKHERDTVTLMGCKIPWNGLTANIELDFNNCALSPDMGIVIRYDNGTGTQYHATKSLPISYYRPLSVRVDYSFYSRKHFCAKEFDYHDVVLGG